jgi:hypothetical protein
VGVGVGGGVSAVASELDRAGCEPLSVGVAVGPVAGCPHTTVIASATKSVACFGDSARLKRRVSPSV